MMLDVQLLARDIQRALGIDVVCGSITLNINAGQVQSVKTETFHRVTPEKSVDKPARPRA